jgi:hypothetical protein
MSIFPVRAKRTVCEAKEKKQKLVNALKMTCDLINDYNNTTRNVPTSETIFKICETTYEYMVNNINKNMINNFIQSLLNVREVDTVLTSFKKITSLSRDKHLIVWCFLSAIKRQLCAIDEKLYKLETLCESAFTAQLTKHIFSEDTLTFVYEKITRMHDKRRSETPAYSSPGRTGYMLALRCNEEALRVKKKTKTELERENAETNKEQKLENVFRKLGDLISEYKSIEQQHDLAWIWEKGEKLVDMMMLDIYENFMQNHIDGLNAQELAIFNSNYREIKRKNAQTHHQILWCFAPDLKTEIDAIKDKLHKLAEIIEQTGVAHLITHFYSDEDAYFNFKDITRRLEKHRNDLERGVIPTIVVYHGSTDIMKAG